MKKAKENRNSMYFRNDRKMMELRKVYKEKERLFEKCTILDDQVHNLKMLNFDKSEELRDVKTQLEKTQEQFSNVKCHSNNEIKGAIGQVEKPLLTKVASLESELWVQKDIVENLKNQYKNSDQNDEILSVLDKMSVMLLTKNQSDSGLPSSPTKNILCRK